MSSDPIISNSKHVVFTFLLISCILKLCYSSSVCHEIERQALLKFKQSLDDPSNILLSSWNISSEDNCCMWKGVVCSNLTGHVHQLHLQSLSRFDGLRGKLNPSLLNLTHLKYLDLSQNYFGGTIPSFVGLLTTLEYLNLSYAGFGGRVPHSLGNLSNLHTLSLDGNRMTESNDDGSYHDVSLDVDSMEWLSGLPRLERLNMNLVNLSKAAANWVEVISKLPSLVELRLSSCALNSTTADVAVNITSLTILDLSGNNFLPFALPKWIFQQPDLVFLDLRGCGFEGPIPTTSNTTKLKYIDLSFNTINSSIPHWLYLCKDLEYVSMRYNFLHSTISSNIGNLTSLNTLDLYANELSGNIPREIASLCKMQRLDLSENRLQGEISYSFGNMSDCFLESLTILNLRENQISGHLTPQFGEFKSLQTLDLGKNSISGAIPFSLGKLSSLEDLGLDNNNFSGNLPESLGQLYNLTSLSVEHNMLQGTVTENHFANLSKLTSLAASGNPLSLKVSADWVPPFKLRDLLELGSWNLGTEIPSWIETQKNVMQLDLSNTGISGSIPTWLWEIRFLNLSHNNLNGQIPDLSGPEDGPRLVYLSSNQFSGSLPRVANKVTELDLSNNSFSGGMSHFLCDTTNETYRLEILHLGGNLLTGELPDCFMRWPSLVVLNLANNNLSGNIPNSIGFLTTLLSLNLHGNKFSGQITSSMHNCTKLVKLDLGGNGFAGNIPTWLGTSLSNLTFLILRSNKLNGEMPANICHLNALQILDLSDNALFGVIPKCVNNFTAMATRRSLAAGYGLDYSYYIGVFFESASVATKGRENHYDTILPLVTNIDLSNNQLSGDIPEELTSLVELRSINFSSNRLTGKIPESMGDMKQLESLDLSNNSLFGEIPNSFTRMFSLNYLNLSFNNLTGRIPSSTQLLSMDASSFIGNHLCDLPLPNKCGGVGDAPEDAEDDNEGDEFYKVKWFYIFLSLGYAVGLSAFCTTFILKTSWRDAYFGLLEFIWNKLYVYFCIKWTRRIPIS